MESGLGSSAMIDITVKTLDGKNRTFTVPENLTVRQFKEKISGSIEIPADTQRLIFQGRVMQDEKVLKDYDIHGKVIHLVQRAPPTSLPGAGPSTSTFTSTTSMGQPPPHMDSNLLDVQIHFNRVPAGPNSREARGRVRQADFNLRLANDAIRLLVQRTRFTPSDYPPPDVRGPESTPGETMDTSSPNMRGFRADGGNLQPQDQSNFDDQPGGLQASELADFLDRVLSTNDRIMPHLRMYRNFLRNEENFPPDSREGRDAQEVVDRLTEALHAMSHMMHSLSDVMVDMSTDMPRRATAVPLPPFPALPGTTSMAIPIHMNFRTRSNGNGNRQSGQHAQPHPTTTATATTGQAPAQAVASTAGGVTTQSSSASATTATTTTTRAPAGSTTIGAATTGRSTATTTTTTSEAAPGVGAFSVPPISARDPSVMVEVFPAGVTVHDIRAVVAQEVVDEDNADSTGGTGNFISSVNIGTATTTTATSTPTTASTPTSAPEATSAPSTAPPPPPSSGRRNMGNVFTTSATSSSATSTFAFGPTTSVSIGGIPNFSQLPNVPGLPPGMLQNIVGSILNSHGVRPGQPVQVNVVQQTTTGIGPRPPQPQQDRHPMHQIISDLPLDDERMHDHLRHHHHHQYHHHHHVHPSRDVLGMAAQSDATQQTPASMDASTGTRSNAATNTSNSGVNRSTNTMTNTVVPDITSTTTSTTITSTINVEIERPAGQFNTSNSSSNSGNNNSSSIGTRTDPNMGTSSRSTNTPRPHLHFHRGSSGASRNSGSQNSRSQSSAGPRPVLGVGSMSTRGYVDPYMPCSSPHFNTQSARAMFRAQQSQFQARGQQPAQQQQQVPNLSTMVGGIIEQMGQVLNNGTRTSTSSATSTTSGSSSSSSSTGTNSSSSEGRQGPRPFNPMEMFSTLFGGPGGAGGQIGPIPFDLGPLIRGMMPSPSTPQGGESRGNIGPTPSPLGTRGDTLADVFTQFRTASQGSDGDAADANVIVALLEAVAPHMGLADLFSLVLGNTGVLSQLRGPLREFVASRVSQHGSVERVVEVALDDMYPEIQHIESLVTVRDGVDMARSIRNCLQKHLTTIFTTIHTDGQDTQVEFGRHLYSLWMTMMAETIGLCVYCISDGQNGFSNMVQRYMPRMTQEMNPAITIWMTTSLQDILGSFHRNHPVPESYILGYVVYKSARPVETANEAKCEGHSPETTPIPSVTSVSATPSVSVDQPVETVEQSPPKPMEVGESPSSQPPKAKVPRTTADDDSESSDIFVDAEEAPSRPTLRARPTTITPSSGSTGMGQVVSGGSKERSNAASSDDWQSVIPQEWIPVISQDIVRQQNQRPQPPLSDAYIQGLPAKRRRMMSLEHAGEMGNMPQYLPSALTRAARAAGVEPISSEENLMQEAADNLELQAELEREVTAVLESRISSDSDFSSERFPNAQEYFHKSKRH